MNTSKPKTPSLAGGIFIAAGMLIGAMIGIYIGQPSAGMVIGLATGAGLAAIVWLFDRKRGN